MPKVKPFTLSPGALRGLFALSRYRFLTIAQFAKVAGFSTDHAGEVLRTLEARRTSRRRRYPGGTENDSIFATVRGSISN